MNSSKTKSNGTSIKLQQSISPSSTNTSSIASFSSPNRINLHRLNVSSSPSVRFSIDHEKNLNQNANRSSGEKKKTCMCSPTTHPGSFRCSLHRSTSNSNDKRSKSTASYQAQRLYARRSAMTNSLVRIGTVEGDLVKRALTSLIRPSSHRQRRRGEFQPRPSRLSVMSKAGD